MKKPVILTSALLLAAFQPILVGADTDKNDATNTAAAVAGRLVGPRSGGCASNLADGSVLITGGHGPSGLVGTAETFTAKGGAKEVAQLLVPRENHACATLPNGTVLVAGGRVNGGGSTNTTEVYDSKTGVWTLGPNMSAARSGAAAVTIAGGKVLFAGGDSNGAPSSTIEIFDPATGKFSTVPGALSSPRSQHAAVSLNNGQVLIAGGSDGKTPLDSIDIYNPATGAVSRLNLKLSSPRAGLTATLLLDGRVFFAGGSDPKGELATTEIYNPKTGAITPAASMNTSRSGHIAVRVPNNNSVYITGGNTRGGVQLLTEVYIPWWNSFKVIGQAGGQAKKTASFASVAPQEASSDTPVLPTLYTDKPDYAPGETAQITGSGWTPSTEVTLVLTRDPETSPATTWTTTADADGNLSTTYNVIATDAGVTFTLTASSSSGDTAQIQTINFTDSQPPQLTVVSSIAGAAGVATFDITYVNNGGHSNTVLAQVTPWGPTNLDQSSSFTISNVVAPSGYTFSGVTVAGNATAGPGAFTGTVGGVPGTATATLNFTPSCTAPNITGQPASQTVTYGASSVTFTATAGGTPAPTVQWQQSTDSGAFWGNIAGATATTLTINNPTVAQSGTQYRAVFTNTCTPGTATTNAATLTVNKADQATVTVTGPSDITYGSTGTAAASGGSGTGAYSFSAGASTGCSLAGTTVSVTDASGTCVLTATRAGDANYNASAPSAPFTVTLHKADQAAVSVTAPTDVTYGSTGTAAASGGSGTGTYSFSAGASTGCSVAGTTVSVSSASGTCALTATRAGDNNYNPSAPSAPFTVILHKADQASVSVTGPTDITYGTTGTATASGGSGSGAYSFSAGASTGCSVAGTIVSVTDASGTCVLTATRAGDANYNASAPSAPVTVTLHKADQAAVSVTAPTDITYGATGIAAASGGSGTGAYSFSAGASTGCSVSGTTVSVSNASGTCVLTATRAGDNNYNPSAPSAPFTVTLHKADQASVSVTGPTDITYGTTGTATASGGSGTGAYSFSAGASTGCSVAATTVSVSNASGTCALTATRAGDNNYNPSAPSSPFTVNLHKAASVTTVTGGSYPYDGLAHPATANVTGAGGLNQAVTPITYSGSCSAAPVTVAQGTTCMASASYPGDNNHEASNGSAAVTITTRPVTVDPVDQTIFYGNSPAAFTYTVVTGSVVSGDSLGTPVFKFNNSTTVPVAVGAYTITVSFSPSNPNYLINTTPTGTFTINKRLTMVTYQGPASAMYGDCSTIFSAKLIDITGGLNAPIAGETILITVGSQSVSGATNAQGIANGAILLNQNAGTYNANASYAGSAIYQPAATANTNNFVISQSSYTGPLAGEILYTGSPIFWTNSSTSSTTSMTLAATIRDIGKDVGGQTCHGDIRTAKLTFAFRNADGSYTAIANNTANLPVGLVSATDPYVGTVATNVQYNLGNSKYNSFELAVIAGGNYTLNKTALDTTITVAVPGQANSIIGGGSVDLQAFSTYPASSGFLGTALDTDNSLMTITTGVTYNKSFTNPQGTIAVEFNSLNKPDGTVNTISHRYRIKSTSITSLKSLGGSKYQFTAKANVSDLTTNTSIDGGAVMQFVVTAGSPGLVEVTVTSSKAGGPLWISSSWNGSLTVPKQLDAGSTIVAQ